MPRYENAADGSDAVPDLTDDADHGRIVIVVVRSGGFAGLRRRWRVEPSPETMPDWVSLVERCPWDQRMGDDAQAGADRFVWSIHAVLPDEQREQVVPDSLLRGAWRELVDAVRAADTE